MRVALAALRLASSLRRFSLRFTVSTWPIVVVRHSTWVRLRAYTCTVSTPRKGTRHLTAHTYPRTPVVVLASG